MLTTVIYARKSSESEDRQVLSIESQIRELRDHAAREGFSVKEVLVESRSAKAPGRPVFGHLLKSIQKNSIDAILCWKLDRLARNPVDGGAIIWSMQENRLRKIITPQREFTNTGNDKFWLQLEFGIAKKYVDDLSDNVKRGMKTKLEKGWYPHLPPLGYLNDLVEHTIVKDPERFLLVRKMWTVMLAGNHTPPEILELATRKWGLRTRQHKRHGGLPLARSSVYKIFSNPFYYGAMVVGGNWYEGRHEPMVTRLEFERVQQLLKGSGHIRPQKHRFAYTGLIRCGNCGAAITAEHKVNRFGSEYTYYHCTRNRKGVRCDERVVEVTELETQILQFLHSMRIGKAYLKWAMDVLKELGAESEEETKSVFRSLEKRRQSCRQRLDLLLNLRLQEMISDAEFSEKKRQLQLELARVETELASMDGKNETAVRRCEETLQFAEQAENAFVTGSDEVKRAILRCVGSNLVLSDRTLLIQAHKPFEILRTGLLGSKKEIGGFEPEMRIEDSLKSRRGVTENPSKGTMVDEIRTWFIENPREELSMSILGSGKIG